MYKPDNNIIQENLKKKSIKFKFMKSQELPYKAEAFKNNFYTITENGKQKDYNIIESLVNVNKENSINNNDDKNSKKYYIKGSQFPRSNRKVKSGNISYRSYNLKLLNSIDKIKNINKKKSKNSYFIINNNLRPLSNDKSRNQDKTGNNKLNQYKTFNKIFNTFY